MSQAETLEKIMNQAPPLHQGKGANQSASSGRIPRVMCITSGKGGVGKTNITTNLAYSLIKQGKKVMILDADLNLANVDVLIGLTPKFNLHHVFTGEKNLSEVIIEGPAGMMILPGSSGILELASLTEKQKLYFLAEMEDIGRDIDFLLIDTAAGINENVIYFNLAAQERIVVLTPEPTSLTDAYALIKVLSTRHDVKKFRILVNMAISDQEAIAVYKQLSLVCDQFLETLSLDFIGHIPYDRQLVKSVRSQKLVTELSPEAQSSKKITAISQQLVNEPLELRPDGNIKFFWQRLFDQ